MNIEKNLQACLKIINESNNIIIVTHTNPDGDAIGSSVALMNYCKSLGKNAIVFLDNDPPENLDFLIDNNLVKIYNNENSMQDFLMTDSIFILDLNDSKRLKNIEEKVLQSNVTKCMIDHHLEPKNFVDVMAVDTDACSTGELIFRMLSYDANFTFTKDIADPLYVAIMTDTGNFRHPRTDAEVFKMCSILIESGADPVKLYDKVYNSNDYNAVKLLGEALRGLELYYNNQLSIMTITNDMLESTNTSNKDLEGFVEKTLQIKGVNLRATSRTGISPIERIEILISSRSG
jgi:phosphoesterase RecJ-like protein